MMKKNRCTAHILQGFNDEANSLSQEHLEKSLVPVWKITYYSGLLFDWCNQIPRQSWRAIAAHCIIIAFCLSVYIQQVVLSSLQIMMTITNPIASLQRLNVRFIGAANQPIVITTWMYYLLRREKFRAFFRDWKRFEEQSSTHMDHAKIKRVRLIIYFLYYTLRIGFYLLIGLASFTTMNTKSENEFIAKHYPHFIELYWVDLWLKCSQLITVFIALTVVQLIEITPVLVYYHISKMINAMEVELKSVIPRQLNVDKRTIKYKSIQTIWSRFENLRVLLTRADTLFGPILVVYHGVTFFVLCSTVFSMLIMVRKPDEREYFSVYIMSLLYTPARLLFSFVMISKVHEAADSLKNTLACLSSRMWRQVSISSSLDCVIQCFLYRLQYTKLTASPSDLYKIKPSILLTLLGLIVSYTIILLQSN